MWCRWACWCHRRRRRPSRRPAADPRKAETAEWVRILEGAGVKVQVWNPSGDERDFTGVELPNVEFCYICERPRRRALPPAAAAAAALLRASLAAGLDVPPAMWWHAGAARLWVFCGGRGAAAARSGTWGRPAPVPPAANQPVPAAAPRPRSAHVHRHH